MPTLELYFAIHHFIHACSEFLPPPTLHFGFLNQFFLSVPEHFDHFLNPDSSSSSKWKMNIDPSISHTKHILHISMHYILLQDKFRRLRLVDCSRIIHCQFRGWWCHFHCRRSSATQMGRNVQDISNFCFTDYINSFWKLLVSWYVVYSKILPQIP